MPENKHARLFLTILYIALGVLAVWLVFKYALPWLSPFIVAFILSRIIEYPVSFFERKLRFPRPLASLLFTLLIYGIIGTLLYFLSLRLFHSMVGLFDNIEIDIDYLAKEINLLFNNLVSYLPPTAQTFVNENIGSWLADLGSSLKSLIAPIASYTIDFAAVLPSVLIFIIAAIASTYFLSSDFNNIKQKISEAVSPRIRSAYRRTRKQVSLTLVCYLKAMLVLVFITFFELSIGLSILRVRNAILIAAIIAIIDALPVLGTGWVIMPWAIVSICMGNYLFAIGLAIIYAVVTVVRNLIEPKIVGEHIGLHPLATLISIYIGLKIFGIVGMFTPIIVALLKKFYEWGYFDFIFKQKRSQKPREE